MMSLFVLACSIFFGALAVYSPAFLGDYIVKFQQFGLVRVLVCGNDSTASTAVESNLHPTTAALATIDARVNDAFSRNATSDVVALLQAMVSIPSVSARHVGGRDHDPEQAISEFLYRFAKRALVDTPEATVTKHYVKGRAAFQHNNTFNVLIRLPPKSKEDEHAAPWQLFHSHVDTVSAEGMTVPPFTGELNKDQTRVVGRGATDTKGSGAAMLIALLKRARDENRKEGVALVFCVDEEGGFTGVNAFVEETLGSELAWLKPRFSVVGEPTSMQPVVTHNGVMTWNLETAGVAAHSSDPSRGVNALSIAARTISHVEECWIAPLDATADLIPGKAVASLTMALSCGSANNIIPDSCLISVNRRLVPGESARDTYEKLEKCLEEVRNTETKRLPASAPAPPFFVRQPAFRDIRSIHPLRRIGATSSAPTSFEANILALLKKAGVPDASLSGAAYATEACVYAEALNVPSVVLGPGTIADAHTKDESLAISQLKSAENIYLTVMRSKE
ncbi:peptidase M20 dimerization domain-containing protein [Pseudoscourfieldia marina]